MTIAQKIKILREVNSWTQEDVAEKLHLSQWLRATRKRRGKTRFAKVRATCPNIPTENIRTDRFGAS